MKSKIRCAWVKENDELEKVYHDTEWGVPVHDDAKHFEFILLDSFQAGLSWNTILHKRENFRKAFSNFNSKRIAKFDQKKIDSLLLDAGIVRNKLKIHATIGNAKAFMAIQKEHGSFDKFIWQFTNHKTKVNKWKKTTEVPALTEEAEAMSKALKKYGMKFVGPTICYAYMQAAGMVNDHTTDCFRYKKFK